MDFLTIICLIVVCFVQNMAFTWTSRSRNSNDPHYHRYAAWCSNGIWFGCHALVWKAIWDSVTSGKLWQLAVIGVIYTLATAEGSVLMMKLLIKKEKGKRRVGAYDDTR